MGNCEFCYNSNDSNSFEDISKIKCTYEIKENDYVQIINNKSGIDINEEIEKKIKILNGGKKEKLIFKKKYTDTGIYSIEFVVEKKLKNMSYMFKDCSALKKIDFISIDTSHVTKMVGMFSGCKEIEYLDLSTFNTLNVIDMKFMFAQCNKLKEIKGLNKFNTINVNRLDEMFNECYELEYLDLSNFNISNATNMELF